MARVTRDQFADRDVACIYLAGTVAEAERVEAVLTRERVAYAVEIEPYASYSVGLAPMLGLVPAQYQRAAFYVHTRQADFCRERLRAVGITSGLVDEPPA